METLPHLFKGLQQAFNFGDKGWESWKNKALMK
jgi:hypothetical protein